jgi:hypothetical protein
MIECSLVFRLQPQANLQSKQSNKMRKNGISTSIFFENISFNPRSVCPVCCVCCACWHGLFNLINYITGVSVTVTVAARSKAYVYASLLRLWVRIPPMAWMSVCCECRALSGRGLCDELITHPGESYRLWCVAVCDLETSWMRRPWATRGLLSKKRTNEQTNKQTNIQNWCVSSL